MTSKLSQTGLLGRHIGMSISLIHRFNTAMIALEATSRGLSTRERLLVQLCASQINGCSYCINLHSREAEKKGIDATPQNPREDLIMRFTTMGTRISDSFDDEMIDEAVQVLGEKTTGDLIAAVVAINAWNRLARLTRK